MKTASTLGGDSTCELVSHLGERLNGDDPIASLDQVSRQLALAGAQIDNDRPAPNAELPDERVGLLPHS